VPGGSTIWNVIISLKIGWYLFLRNWIVQKKWNIIKNFKKGPLKIFLAKLLSWWFIYFSMCSKLELSSALKKDENKQVLTNCGGPKDPLPLLNFAHTVESFHGFVKCSH
jgi:hypothetical protein